ncbi:hypothetical protein [Poseidonocella sedimentorum]|uniref:O-antigen ligase like membrane protein n=1 Tax=Poseidonocella sedimentorum TaxID=871652 RepID=A0A1I6ENC1_9RHOB|nr:hypothetical protein [Poseidonocella sedimentorum]SFR19230.1 hypothetical protein SAMN04515673_1169 [Poseidonocella sedimentorum]
MIPPLPVLFVWPVVAYILFQRFDRPRALVLTILLGYLFLPEHVGLNLPVLPTLEKSSIPSLAACAMLFLLRPQGAAARRRAGEAGLAGLVPRSRPIQVLLLMMVGGAFLTPLANGDPIRFTAGGLPGLGMYDSFSSVMTAVIGLLPLLLARKYLATPESHRMLLGILAIAGAGYAILALWEIRMSPQLSAQIYGIGARSWDQQLRAGGYRPLVFLEHGLWLGIFFACATLAAFAAWRAAPPETRPRYLGAGLVLLVTLGLSKTLGALMIVIVLLPVILFLSVRLQMLVAAAIAALVIFYPPLRSADIVPVDRVVEFARGISAERAGSLQFRINNEDALLDKAMERPVLGWGGWGRARVYDEDGRDLSITDGRWVIAMGLGGLTRYFGEFGLLAGALLLLALRRRSFEIDAATAGLCLVLAANLVDLLPNAGLTPLTWLLAGALIGRVELARVQPDDAMPAPVSLRAGRRWRGGAPAAPDASPDPGLVTARDPAADPPRRTRYTRFAGPATGRARSPRKA